MTDMHIPYSAEEAAARTAAENKVLLEELEELRRKTRDYIIEFTAEHSLETDETNELLSRLDLRVLPTHVRVDVVVKAEVLVALNEFAGESEDAIEQEIRRTIVTTDMPVDFGGWTVGLSEVMASDVEVLAVRSHG